MDELDQKILKVMEREGFKGSNELATILGTSPRTIQRHMKKMNQEGIFKTVAVPNFPAFGFHGWARIGIKVDPKLLDNVARELVTNHFVYFVAYSLGYYDLIISVAMPSIEMLIYFVNYELTNIEGITAKETMLMVHPVKYYRYRWASPIFKKYQSALEFDAPDDHPRYEATDLDRKILQIWLDNGLIRPGIMSKKLGAPENVVRKRMKYMRENQVVTLEVVPNKEVLEDEAWATIGVNTRHKFDNRALELIINNPDVYLVSFCLGKFDLVIAVRFKNTERLTQFLNSELSMVEGISSFETFLHGKPLKYHNTRLGEPFRH